MTYKETQNLNEVEKAIRETMLRKFRLLRRDLESVLLSDKTCSLSFKEEKRQKKEFIHNTNYELRGLWSFALEIGNDKMQKYLKQKREALKRLENRYSD